MRYVVTCPSNAAPLEFAVRAKDACADYLEIRDDLTDGGSDLHSAAAVIPLVVSRRREAMLPGAWIEAASLVDQEVSLPRQSLGIAEERIIYSHHSAVPLDLDDAAGMWEPISLGGGSIKHVEPYQLGCESRLLGLQERLSAVADRVTVLATGVDAIELRRMLSSRNHLHYCALESDTRSAEGQAILAEEIVAGAAMGSAARRVNL